MSVELNGGSLGAIADPRALALREHNAERNYVSWYEKLFHLHSLKIRQLGDLQRPGLTVINMGAGPSASYLDQAVHIVGNGGRYVALDLESLFILQGEERLKTYPGEVKDNILIKQANVNLPLANDDTLVESSSDVVIMSSLNANPFLGELKAMYQKLMDDNSQSSAKIASYLKPFIENTPLDAEDSALISGSNAANILPIINAFLLLKPGGRLVYSWNDQNMMIMNTLRIKQICEALGFEKVVIQDPITNMFTGSQTRLTYVVAEKPS